MPREPRQPYNGGSVKPEGATRQPNPEHRDDEARIELFRQQTREALQAAQVYNGTEERYEALMDRLIEVAETVASLPELEGDTSLHREMDAALKHLTGTDLEGMDVTQMMSVSFEARRKSLRNQFDQAQRRQSAEIGPDENETVYLKKSNAVFLPPGTMEREVRPGERHWEPTRFEPRLTEVLALLESAGIFSDDLIVTIGSVTPDMMREVGYAVVEIPRLKKTILVCDQVGEATFVLQGYFSEDVLTRLNKEQLQEAYPNDVRRITRHNYETWAAEIQALVLTDETWAPKSLPKEALTPRHEGQKREKLTARHIDAMRTAIMQQVPTGKDWVGLSPDMRIRLKFNGYGIQALSGIFGLGESAVNSNLLQYRLGAEVYGHDNPDIRLAIEAELRTPEQWIAIVKKNIPTSADWLALPRETIRRMVIDGWGMRAIGGRIGFEGAVDTSMQQLQLAKCVYGPDDPALKKDEGLLTRTPDQWRDRIKQVYPTSADWIALRVNQFPEIDGLGYQAVASVFGRKQEARDRSTLGHLLIGEAIYGTEDLAIQDGIAKERRTPSDWFEKIREAYPTPEEWFAKPTKDMRAERIDGETIETIAGLVGIKYEGKRLFVSEELLLDLAAFVYGADNPMVAKVRAEWEQKPKKVRVPLAEAREVRGRTLDEWRGRIKELYPTSADWLKVTWARMSIDGTKLTGFMNIFGIASADNSRKEGLMLGLAIYGPDPALEYALKVENRTPDEWRVEIKKVIPTAQAWANMSVTERGSLKVDGYAIGSIGTIFGKYADHLPNKLMPQLELGVAIFNDDPAPIEYAITVEKRTPDEWRARFKEIVPTAADWIALGSKGRDLIRVDRYGITAIAGIFGVKGKVQSNNILHMQIGAAIYGADDPDIVAALARFSQSK